MLIFKDSKCWFWISRKALTVNNERPLWVKASPNFWWNWACVMRITDMMKMIPPTARSLKITTAKNVRWYRLFFLRNLIKAFHTNCHSINLIIQSVFYNKNRCFSDKYESWCNWWSDFLVLISRNRHSYTQKVECYPYSILLWYRFSYFAVASKAIFKFLRQDTFRLPMAHFP